MTGCSGGGAMAKALRTEVAGACGGVPITFLVLGLTAAEIAPMLKANPARLLGLDEPAPAAGGSPR